MPSHDLSAAALEQAPPEGNARVLRLAGRMDAYSVGPLWQPALAALADHATSPVIIDAAGVEYCDDAGIALLVDLLRGPRPAGAEVTVRRLAGQFERLLQQFDPKRFAPRRPPPGARVGVTERVGRAGVALLREGYERIAFVGESAVGLARTFANPLHIRWHDALAVAQRVGADAVPIVSLVGFLIGVILAFQSATALRRFGGEIFVPNLVALSILRELGPLMTAILMAGRSGSAFAAEIGTMKVNEEIDALITMGISPAQLLVIPRLVAGLLLCPLLTLIANLTGLLGGAVVMVGFGFPPAIYFQQAQSAVSPSDLFGGVAKALVFGLLVAGIGCMHGLRTGEGPSAVGQSTTRAVVGGIILIVAADGLFALLYDLLGI